MGEEQILSSEERYKLVGKLIEEIKLRRYSYQTGKSYIYIVKKFLELGKTPREFLLSYSTKSKSTMRSVYFALKFFYENVLNKKFEEKLPSNFSSKENLYIFVRTKYVLCKLYCSRKEYRREPSLIRFMFLKN